MGSREEFFSAVKLVRDKKIQPVVDSVLSGLGEAEKGFQLLKEGGQFGKVCRLRASEVLQLGGLLKLRGCFSSARRLRSRSLRMSVRPRCRKSDQCKNNQFRFPVTMSRGGVGPGRMLS